MASTILILSFVLHELSFDKFHDKADRMYRICARGVIGDTKVNQVYTTARLPEALKMEYAEVEETVRMLDRYNVKVRVGDKLFNESRIVLADSTFYQVFSFPLIKGDIDNVLNEPNTIVLSESTAKKYFGEEDPINQVIQLYESLDVKVTGVMADMPENSHFHFDLVGSVVSMPDRLNDVWWNNNFKTYIVLNKDADPAALESKFPAFIKKYLGEGNDDWDEWLEAGNNWQYFLQPITSIHLNSNLNGEFEPNGNINYIYIFISAAIFLLIIASVNFMNLTTAKSEKRAREVGLRKVVGSGKNLLIVQFLVESIIMSIGAFIFATIIITIALPAFNDFTGKSIGIWDIFNWSTAPILLIAVLLIGIFSGLYPALYLSSYKALEALKKKPKWGKKSFSFRGLLVVFQFVISIFMIIGTLVVYRQLNYLQNVNLGYSKDQIILIDGAGELGNNLQTFKEHLLANHSIIDVSASNTVPGKGFMNWGCNAEGIDDWLTLNMNLTDHDFLATYQMEMADGRFFSTEFPSDSSAIIINENALKLLEWEEPIEKKMNLNGRDYRIVGIIKDFHYESLHTEVRPMGMIMFPTGWNPNFISVKISGDQIPETFKYIEETWAERTNNYPFQYSFFDQEYQQLYENEQKTGNLFILFSIIAIFIASLGLFALSAFVAEQRTKEIGIRKVNGASVKHILVLLSSNFSKWVITAFIIAIPISFYVMNLWLQNFAYKSLIVWWLFPIAGLIALIIALLTVSYQSVVAAVKNPVDTLRYE